MFLSRFVSGKKSNRRRLKTVDLVGDQVRKILSSVDQKLILAVRD